MSDGNRQLVYLAMAAVALLGVYLQFRLFRRLYRGSDSFWGKRGVEFGIRLAFIALIGLYIVFTMGVQIVSLFDGRYQLGISFIGVFLFLYILAMSLLVAAFQAIIFLVLEFVRCLIGPLLLTAVALQVLWMWADSGVLEFPNMLDAALDTLFSIGPEWMQYAYVAVMAGLSVWDGISDLFTQKLNG